MADDLILVDEPASGVRRITLNRPEKRNALNHPLRGAILDALAHHDVDPDVRVPILRGAGMCLASGYDLRVGSDGPESPSPTPPLSGPFPRRATAVSMVISDPLLPGTAQAQDLCPAG